MSQFRTTSRRGLEVIYGLDHAVGYFLTVFDEDEDGEEDVLISLSTAGPFWNAHRTDIVDWLRENVDITPEISRHIHRILMDLDPKEEE